ncbi:MAG TPA: hypothetical protein VFE32_19205 [Puia sp.]|nr:hypothetical protein [Puia sp.]
MDLYLTLESLSLCISLFLLHPRNDRNVRLLIVILAVTLAAELLGRYAWRPLHLRNNHPIYNLSVPLIIVLYLALFSSQLRNAANRRTVGWVLAGFGVFAIINLGWIQRIGYFNSSTYIVGSIGLALAGVLYYFELVKKKDYVNLSREPMFWITAAVLLVYIPMAVIYSVFAYLTYYALPISNSFGATRQLLNMILSLIFCALIAWASICLLISRK